MEIEFSLKAKNDLDDFLKKGNSQILKKIRTLLESISATPFSGIGKPEALKYELAGLWSRRINKEHRLIYEVHPEKVIIHSLKGHYH